MNYEKSTSKRGLSGFKSSCPVRGGYSLTKRRSTKELVGKENPDVLVLQEIKKEEVDRKFVGSLVYGGRGLRNGYSSLLWVDLEVF